MKKKHNGGVVHAAEREEDEDKTAAWLWCPREMVRVGCDVAALLAMKT